MQRPNGVEQGGGGDVLASWGVHREDEAFTSLGPYEAAGALGFAYWLGLPRELAALAATAFHGLSQLHDYSLGLLALLWIMAPWAGRRRGGPVG